MLEDRGRNRQRGPRSSTHNVAPGGTAGVSDEASLETLPAATAPVVTVIALPCSSPSPSTGPAPEPAPAALVEVVVLVLNTLVLPQTLLVGSGRCWVPESPSRPPSRSDLVSLGEAVPATLALPMLVGVVPPPPPPPPSRLETSSSSWARVDGGRSRSSAGVCVLVQPVNQGHTRGDDGRGKKQTQVYTLVAQLTLLPLLLLSAPAAAAAAAARVA